MRETAGIPVHERRQESRGGRRATRKIDDVLREDLLVRVLVLNACMGPHGGGETTSTGTTSTNTGTYGKYFLAVVYRLLIQQIKVLATTGIPAYSTCPY